MNWLTILGLEAFINRWRANVIEAAIAAEDRMELMRLEWCELKKRLQQILVLTVLVGGLTVVALIMLSMAVLVHFWDSPERTMVGWIIAGVWVAGWIGALVALVMAARRAGSGFALTRNEMAHDWRQIKELL